MKNKKIIVLGISIAMIMCVVVGCGNSNNETVETVAMVETEEPATAEEVEETPQPVEEAPAVEESVEKEEEKEEAEPEARRPSAARRKHREQAERG